MADTQTIHPHLSGLLAPVRSEHDVELKVVGRIPDALAGAYYRNGPNPQFDPQGNAIAHIDIKTGQRALRMLDPGDAADEPIFVPRSASAPEGDGYVIVLVYRAASNTSELLILNAQEIADEPVAVLKVPRRVPAGFHGNFVPA
jgi:carotenoid cleavage dioxygenase-like enzyme